MSRKRFFILGVALILFAMVVGTAFAVDEYEYTVTVTFHTRNGLGYVTYTLWASSAAEATQMATAKCTAEKGDVASCGGAIATGRKKES